ncbi:MAG: RDD family protein [Elusimicrobiota bacterium]|nr:MAG: RDD family protein [Elusimicrobiota bacterium]
MELATRKQRLGAALADGIIVAIPYAIGSLEAAPAPLRLVAVIASLGLLVYQLRLVSKTGQTIGKRWVGIRIVLKEGLVNGGFVTNVVKRGLVNGLLCLIPVYFLVDCAFIFRDDRRCLHDMIAGTCVIVAEPDVVQ